MQMSTYNLFAKASVFLSSNGLMQFCRYLKILLYSETTSFLKVLKSLMQMFYISPVIRNHINEVQLTPLFLGCATTRISRKDNQFTLAVFVVVAFTCLLLFLLVTSVFQCSKPVLQTLSTHPRTTSYSTKSLLRVDFVLPHIYLEFCGYFAVQRFRCFF